MTAPARKRAPRKKAAPKAAAQVEQAPSQASRYADEARVQRQGRSGGETPLDYARRMAGWPRLREVQS